MGFKIARHFHRSFQQVRLGILNRIGRFAQQMLLDVVLQRLLVVDDVNGLPLANLTTAYLPGGDCKITYVSGDRAVGAVLQIAAGLGFKRDDSEADLDSPAVKPVYVQNATNLPVLAPSNATNPRIDRLFARPKLLQENIKIVDVADPSTFNPTTGLSAVSQQSLEQDERFAFETIVATGTPASSPTAPPLPSGWLATDEIAQITVNPGSGSISTAQIQDLRVILRFPADFLKSLAASRVTVASPLSDASLQAALARMDIHAATHTSNTDPNRLPFLIRNIAFGSGSIALSTADYLTQTLDFTGRGGVSRVLIFASVNAVQIAGSGHLDFTIQASVNGVGVGPIARWFIDQDTNAMNVDIAHYLQNAAAAAGQTFGLKVTFTQSTAGNTLNGWIAVIDLGRV